MANAWLNARQLAAFKTYKIWRAVNLHFISPSYDYFQYSGEVRLNFETFITGNNWKDSIRLHDWIIREKLDPLKVIYALQSDSYDKGVSAYLGAPISAHKAVYQAWNAKYGSKSKMNSLKASLDHLDSISLIMTAVKDSSTRDEVAYTLYFREKPNMETLNTFQSRMYEILVKRQMFYVLFYTG